MALASPILLTFSIRLHGLGLFYDSAIFLAHCIAIDKLSKHVYVVMLAQLIPYNNPLVETCQYPAIIFQSRTSSISHFVVEIEMEYYSKPLRL
jgi:hypothetical protein